jgi:hypothetical protein
MEWFCVWFVLPLAPQIQENTIATLIIFLTRRHASLIGALGKRFSHAPAGQEARF